MTPGIYYNPKTNKIIEVIKKIPFEVCGVEIDLYDIHDSITSVVILDNIYSFPTGPLLGLTKSNLKGYYKIGNL